MFAQRILVGVDENGEDVFEEFPATRMEHYQKTGGLFEAVTEEDDFGWVFQDPNGVTQLRLGPLRRTLNRQKFNKQGGFSQKIGVGQQSGTTIAQFQNIKLFEFELFEGLKTNFAMNTTITQYTNGSESTSLPPPE